MCTQALLMADTRTSSSGPRARFVTPSGVRVSWRCASKYSPASECCSWWHSTHLQRIRPVHECTRAVLAAFTTTPQGAPLSCVAALTKCILKT